MASNSKGDSSELKEFKGAGLKSQSYGSAIPKRSASESGNSRFNVSQIGEDSNDVSSFIFGSKDSMAPGERQNYQLATDKLLKSIERVEDLHREAETKRENERVLRHDKKRQQLLFECVRAGDVAALRKLVKGDIDINAKDRFSVSPLHHASSEGHAEIVEILLEARADTNSTDLNRWTPLHAAAIGGHLYVCKLLLQRGADPTKRSQDGAIPLHYFARIDVPSDKPDLYIEVLLMLMKYGADINAPNNNMETPLHEAAFRGSRESVLLFIKFSKAKINVRTVNGETPLHYAVRAGKKPIVQLLLEMGADVNISGKQGTPQQVAVREGRTDILRVLTEQKKPERTISALEREDPTVQYMDPRTDLMKESLEESFEVKAEVDELLRAGGIRDHYGFVVEKEHVDTYSMFISKYTKVLVERKAVWIKFLETSNIDEELFNKTVQLKKMIRKGIPHEFRGDMWYKIACSNKNANLSEDYYQDLLKKKSAVEKEIDKDVTRTFPGHNFFKSHEGRSSLKNILVAYSIRNPSLGYCQSMNFLAGLLLQLMPEDRAFWVLCYIVEDILEDYFISSMIGLSVDQRILGEVIEVKLPKVHQYFQAINFPLSVLTTKWMMCVFLNTIPIESVLRIWDCFLFEGSKIVLMMCFNIIKTFENAMFETAATPEVMSMYNTSTRGLFDCDSLMKGAFRYENLFEDDQLVEMRLKYWTAIETEVTKHRHQIMMLQRDRKFFIGTVPAETILAQKKKGEGEYAKNETGREINARERENSQSKDKEREASSPNKPAPLPPLKVSSRFLDSDDAL